MDNLKDIYLKWDGRISRTDYWIYSIPIILAFLANEFLITEAREIPYLIVLALIIYPSMMINIKRAHDRNRTGFFSLLLVVPIISLWPLIEFGFIKGSNGKNKYGNEH